MNYYFEFGGGLGDIFCRMFAAGEYRALEQLLPEDRARITLYTVNPFTDELFKWHPKHQQITATRLPHWLPHEDEEKRRQYGLPPSSEITYLPATSEVVNFYPSPSDLDPISRLEDRPYLVLAASAGGEWRVFPDPVVTVICNEAARLQMNLVCIGRNYVEQRGGPRHEPVIPKNEHTVDLVDRLSVPGTATLLEGATGVICSHSSICLLAWLLNKPTLLLYPEEVYRRVVVERRDGYGFGLDLPTTRHALFRSCSSELICDFFGFASQHARGRQLLL